MDGREARRAPDPAFVLRGHDAIVHSLAFCRGAPGLLAAADDHGIVRVWDMATRRASFQLQASRSGSVLAVQSLSGNRLLTQGKDGMYQVWDLEVSGGGSKGEGACASACASVESVGAAAQAAFDLHSFCKCVLVGGDVSGAVTGAGASELVALPYAGCDVALWDVRTRQVQSILQLGRQGQRRGEQGTGVLSGGGQSATGMLTALSSSAFAPTALVIGAYEDGCVRIWDLRSSVPLCCHRVNADAVFALSAVQNKALTLVSGGVGGRISMTRVCGSMTRVCGETRISTHDTPREATREAAGHDCEQALAPACPAGQAGSVRNDVGMERKQDARSGKAKAESVTLSTQEESVTLSTQEAASFDFKRAGQEKEGVNAIAGRNDGKIVAVACWDGLVRVYGVRRPRALGVLKCHSAGVQSVAFSPDCTWLASASDDTRIALWSIFQDED